MKATRYRAGERRYLAVDAELYVPDRSAFAATHCDPQSGVQAPSGERPGLVHTDQGVSGPRGGPGVTGPGGSGVALDGGPGGRGTDRPRGADGVLFLALEPDFNPPRVVMTVVHPDGDRTPSCTEGVRCAARWAAERTDADRVMVDTQAGTREARVHADGDVSVEVRAGEHEDAVPMERGGVVREFEIDVDRGQV